MKFVSPKRLAVRKMVVGIHDFFRARVDPPPSNMLKMVFFQNEQQKITKLN
jgi:hypothetical protein